MIATCASGYVARLAVTYAPHEKSRHNWLHVALTFDIPEECPRKSRAIVYSSLQSKRYAAACDVHSAKILVNPNGKKARVSFSRSRFYHTTNNNNSSKFAVYVGDLVCHCASVPDSRCFE